MCKFPANYSSEVNHTTKNVKQYPIFLFMSRKTRSVCLIKLTFSQHKA